MRARLELHLVRGDRLAKPDNGVIGIPCGAAHEPEQPLLRPADERVAEDVEVRELRKARVAGERGSELVELDRGIIVPEETKPVREQRRRRQGAIDQAVGRAQMIEDAIADARVGFGRTEVNRFQTELAVALAKKQKVPECHGDLLSHTFLGTGEALVELVTLLLVEPREPRRVCLDVTQRRERPGGARAPCVAPRRQRPRA